MSNKSSALRQRRQKSGHENVIAQPEISLAANAAPSDTPNAANAAQPKGHKMASDTSTTGEKKERRQNLTYTYRDKDGLVSDKFTDDTRSVIFTVDQTGKSLELAINEIIKEQSVIDWLAENAPIAIRAFIFGVKTTCGNAVTSVKSGSGEEMFQAIENRKETLVEGEWREGGERGPSPKLVLEAIITCYTAKTGKQPNEAKLKAFKDLIRKEGTKFVLTDADILAEFEAIKLREQQKKVDEAKRQAAEAQGDKPTAMGSLMVD